MCYLVKFIIQKISVGLYTLQYSRKSKWITIEKEIGAYTVRELAGEAL